MHYFYYVRNARLRLGSILKLEPFMKFVPLFVLAVIFASQAHGAESLTQSALSGTYKATVPCKASSSLIDDMVRREEADPSSYSSWEDGEDGVRHVTHPDDAGIEIPYYSFAQDGSLRMNEDSAARRAMFWSYQIAISALGDQASIAYDRFTEHEFRRYASVPGILQSVKVKATDEHIHIRMIQFGAFGYQLDTIDITPTDTGIKYVTVVDLHIVLVGQPRETKVCYLERI